MYKRIILKKGKEESLKRFHPWVFSGAIKSVEDGIADGDTVNVVDADGNFLAVGHFQEGSISVRVLSFTEQPIDDDFWKRRILSAYQARVALGLACSLDSAAVDDSSMADNGKAFRLVHGEGDGMPGLIIDVYGETAVMQAHSIGMHVERKNIAKALVEQLHGRVKNVYYKSETTLPFMDRDEMNGFIYGGSQNNIAVENNLKFYVDWIKGQKTGFFIDQRDNRQLLETLSYKRRVLNMFCYTGGFSVYALRGGAECVHSVDSSAKAIELTKENVALNFSSDNRHQAYCEDAFRYLDHIEKGAYDLVVLDPPAFAKHRGALHNALKGYIRLNQKGFEKIGVGGILFTFSCSQVVTKENFRNAVFTAAALANRKVRVLYQLHQPADHPINIFHPEGEYLKGLVLYVE